jgi:hypothetical protein
MGFDFDVVRNKARPPLRSNSASNRNCTFMIGVVGIQQREIALESQRTPRLMLMRPEWRVCRALPLIGRRRAPHP